MTWRRGSFDVLVPLHWERGGHPVVFCKSGLVNGSFGIDHRYYGFVVTHIRSGRRMATFGLQHTAREFCRRIGHLIDWDTVEATGCTEPKVSVAKRRLVKISRTVKDISAELGDST